SYKAGAQVIRGQVSEWTEILDANSLSTPNEAGTDLNPTLETTPNYNQLDVNNVKNTQNWRVTVSKLDINWTPLFVPYVQRTSIGIPCGACTGVNVGTSVTGYMPITDLEQDFIYGTGKVSDIDLQFRIEGITLAVKADYYRTTVVFTLYGD
ncbi:MAG: hypothetical protein ACPF9D_14555, partial [Owenweeksia sp.]